MGKIWGKDWTKEDKLGSFFRPWKTLDRKSRQDDQKKAMERQQILFDAMNYEPAYATQRAQSPLARSYLESMLAGNNPDAISSTMPNADLLKADATASRDAMFGTQQDLLAQGKALREQPMPKIEQTNPLARNVEDTDVPPEFVDWYTKQWQATQDKISKSMPGIKFDEPAERGKAGYDWYGLYHGEMGDRWRKEMGGG